MLEVIVTIFTVLGGMVCAFFGWLVTDFFLTARRADKITRALNEEHKRCEAEDDSKRLCEKDPQYGIRVTFKGGASSFTPIASEPAPVVSRSADGLEYAPGIVTSHQAASDRLEDLRRTLLRSTWVHLPGGRIVRSSDVKCASIAPVPADGEKAGKKGGERK